MASENEYDEYYEQILKRRPVVKRKEVANLLVILNAFLLYTKKSLVVTLSLFTTNFITNR